MVTPPTRLGADLSARLLERQIRAAARAAPLANVAHAVAIVYMGSVVLPVDPVDRIWWIAVGVGLCLLTQRWSWGRRLGNRRIQAEMLLATVGFGGLWAVATAWVFTAGGRADQVLLAGLAVGVVGAGAIALSTHRAIALSWVAALSAGPLVVSLSHPDPTLGQLAVMVTIYDVAMVIGVLYLSDSFRARCLAEEEAEAGRADLRLLLDDFEAGAREWLWETRDGVFDEVSDRFAQMAARSAEDLEGMTLPGLLQTLRAEEYREGRAARAVIERSLRSGEPFAEIVVPVRVGRERRWWSLSGKRHTDGRWRGLGSDLTESVLAQHRIERLATTDPITGLANREALNRELLARLDRLGDSSVHLGIVDVDNFKAVNDTLGHPAGDQLIVQIAATMTDELRPGEFCARFGGDEFAVILADGVTPANAAVRFGELHRAIKQHSYTVAGNTLAMTGSIGVAASTDSGGDPAGLISCADLALYAAKGDGRDQVRFWTAELSEGANRRAELIQDITRGIEEDQFEIYWQPQIDLADDGVVGLEALLRWNHPRLGLLAPAQFLQVATESGLIVQLGRLVLDTALEAAAGWSGGLRISINVSARELLSAGFVENLVRRVDRSGVGADRLVLEVTEDVLLKEEAEQALLALHRSGFEISMDDFGTGYSSFALLARMGFDEIKIDRSFIRPLADDPTFRTLVRTVIDMAAALGSRVVAEGVETSQQRELLRAMGCQTFQGFLEARPAPRATMEAYLQLAGRR